MPKNLVDNHTRTGWLWTGQFAKFLQYHLLWDWLEFKARGSRRQWERTTSVLSWLVWALSLQRIVLRSQLPQGQFSPQHHYILDEIRGLSPWNFRQELYFFPPVVTATNRSFPLRVRKRLAYLCLSFANSLVQKFLVFLILEPVVRSLGKPSVLKNRVFLQCNFCR